MGFYPSSCSIHAERRPLGGGCSCHETELLRGQDSCVREEGHALSGGFGQHICYLWTRCKAMRRCWATSICWFGDSSQNSGSVLSRLGKLPYLFVDATDPTVASSILKSWRDLPRASYYPAVLVCNCMLWEVDL